MSNGNEPTPEPLATALPEPTATNGTVNGQETAGEATGIPAEPDYKTKFQESSKEGKRLYDENAQLKAQLYAMQNQPRPVSQPVPVASPIPEYRPAAPTVDYSQLPDAVLNRDGKAFQNWEQSIEQRIMGNLGQLAAQAHQQQTTNQRIGASMQVVVKEMRDPALAAEAWKVYNEIASDPLETVGMIPDFVDMPGTNVKINPHVMAAAVKRVKAQQSGKLGKIEAEARQGSEYFVEPSQPVHKPAKQEFDPQKHLSEAERAVCQNTHVRTHTPLDVVYKNYWKNLDDPKKPVSLRAERLKSGKPITYRQLGY